MAERVVTCVDEVVSLLKGLSLLKDGVKWAIGW